MSEGGTVGKAMAVLDQVASFGRPVRFSLLLAASSFPKATLYRLVRTLTQQGMLQYDSEAQTYQLGVRLVRLAHAAWDQSALAPLARPHLDALSRDIGETVHLAHLESAQVLYVDKRNAAQPVDMFSDAGKIGPAYCTGVGKAMLAFLPDHERRTALDQQSYHCFTKSTFTSARTLERELAVIRARGYAFDREEHELGILCIAVPILCERGQLLGGLSLTGPQSRVSLTSLERHAPRLQNTARAIAVDVRAWRFPTEKKQIKRTGT